MEKFLLASTSPRRRALLSELGWLFETVNPEYEEKAVEGETADELTKRFALGKASSVFHKYPDSVVIGADTAVVIDNEILGKPKTAAEACQMLSKLQGKTHVVITSVAIYVPKLEPLTFTEKTEVMFRTLSGEDIMKYVATGESFDKAGAYAIQGHGMLLVEKINGCYFNVVGLPVEHLSKVLVSIGFSMQEQWRN